VDHAINGVQQADDDLKRAELNHNFITTTTCGLERFWKDKHGAYVRATAALLYEKYANTVQVRYRS
jgi:hypothetical protein